MGTGPYGGGWRKDGQFRKPNLPDRTLPTTSGRRLTRAEVEQVAAEMGMSVTAYRRETELEKWKREEAYRTGKARAVKSSKAIGPNYLYDPNKPKKKRRR